MSPHGTGLDGNILETVAQDVLVAEQASMSHLLDAMHVTPDGS